MEHGMILSASGWRKIFAKSGDAEDTSADIGRQNTQIAALAAETFAQYLKIRLQNNHPVIAVGTDSRPTGNEIAKAVLRSLLHCGLSIKYLGVTAAPEIMAYARTVDAFLYISASHNPIAHNGIKFGMNDGGVLPESEAKKLIASFEQKCADSDAERHADSILSSVDDAALNILFNDSKLYKQEALKAYATFTNTVVAGIDDEQQQEKVFSAIKEALETQPLTVVCDMNGSARTASIDAEYLPSKGLVFKPFNAETGKIAHAIIPEPENLTYCAEAMQKMQKDGDSSVKLGYMPDCDGDRGNIVYWNEKTGEAKPIPAQEVFALCVMAESAFDIWLAENASKKSLFWKAQNSCGKKAIAVNCPTSIRIDRICEKFGISLFRAEVGEANVVNLAQKKRDEGYSVRILGEGSNGGNITYPSCVRDPLATLFAIVKLLTIRDKTDSEGVLHKGPFHIWCEKSDQLFKYKEDFSLADILDTLPVFTTTGVSENRAVLTVKTKDKGILKERFQTLFIAEWENHKEEMEAIYGIARYEAATTNGTKETRNVSDWNNGTGGLKIRFFDEKDREKAFIWMRPSGTEDVFRILCDFEGNEEASERSLLRWETSMIKKADDMDDEEVAQI